MVRRPRRGRSVSPRPRRWRAAFAFQASFAGRPHPCERLRIGFGGREIRQAVPGDEGTACIALTSTLAPRLEKACSLCGQKSPLQRSCALGRTRYWCSMRRAARCAEGKIPMHLAPFLVCPARSRFFCKRPTYYRSASGRALGRYAAAAEFVQLTLQVILHRKARLPSRECLRPFTATGKV
jgi:hypothetical protein